MNKEKIDALERIVDHRQNGASYRVMLQANELQYLREAIAELRGKSDENQESVFAEHAEHYYERAKLAERTLRELREQPKQVRCGGCDFGVTTLLSNNGDVHKSDWYCADAEGKCSTDYTHCSKRSAS